MKQKLKIFLILSFVINAYPQQTELKFRHITVDDGLSQNTINCIHQDKHGFIWFGTQDGLNRFDGYNFKIYRYDPKNKNFLSNNYIWNIYEDSDGIFWIGTFGGGLNRFDPATETFTNFKHDASNPNSLSNDKVFRIIEDSNEKLWLATDNGVNSFNKKTGFIKRFLSIPENSSRFRNFHIRAVAQGENDIIWAATDTHLVKIDIPSGKAEYYLSDPFEGKIPLGNIQSLTRIGDDLLVTCSAGLVKLNLKLKKASIELGSSIKNIRYEFRTFYTDVSGSYWIGTPEGIIHYTPESSEANVYSYNPANPEGLIASSVISIKQTYDGSLWIGTRNGLNKLDRIKENFTLVKQTPNSPAALSHKSVNMILEDDNGMIWLGTPDGLNLYDRVKHTNRIFRNNINDANSLGSNYILCGTKDKSGNIWIGTRGGGLNRIIFSGSKNKDNTRFERIIVPGSNTVHSVYEDKEGTLWIGTGGSSIMKYDREKNSFISYPSNLDGSGPAHSYIYCMLEDSYGNFWIGTPTGGLNLMDRKTGRFIYFKNNTENTNSLSNDIVLSVYESDEGAGRKYLWIGTSRGLNKLAIPLKKNMFEYFSGKDTGKDSLFTFYGSSCGFPNEVIYGMLEDDKNNFWISTNKGLVKFNRNMDKPVAKIFDIRDGLQNNEFNQNAYYRNSKGEMFFGGADGLNIFHPDSIRENTYIPPVVITDFLLSNESVSVQNPDKKKFSLKNAIYLTKEIELLYDHNIISFEFSALSYIHSEKNQYAYMMEGFDKGWIQSGYKRYVTYTNLKPGSYTFRVKASNNDGLWNEQGAAIRLIIPPPPWLSWYAYVFYLAVFAAAVFLFIKYRIRKGMREIEIQATIERAIAEEREEVRRKSSADFHDEAGNKLTKISLLTNLAKNASENDPSLMEYLQKIDENTKELASGMRDFIWVLDPTNDSLYDTMNRLKDFGTSIFSYTDIYFILTGLKDDMINIPLPMEKRRALILIYKEAMNNCIKYSQAKNAVLKIEMASSEIKITLQDDGIGFCREELSGNSHNYEENSGGYGLKNMAVRAKKINGRLFINSAPGEGTTVTLTFHNS